jgi:hypothetical protein
MGLRSRTTRRVSAAALLAVPLTLAATAAASVPAESARVMALHAKGYEARGGIAQRITADGSSRYRSLTHFTSSFAAGGVTYPYTMVGNAPATGRSSTLRTVIIPLRLAFRGFGKDDTTFDPAYAVRNILRSPIYNDATYSSGTTQFGDALQRATFWNGMDARRRWHTLLAEPKVVDTITMVVTPATGYLTADGPNGELFGNVNIDVLDARLRALVARLGIRPGETPIFVTQNATADVALGYHDAYTVHNADGTDTLQTIIYTSWLDPALVGDLLGDVSTLNHEIGEWYDDPFVNNITPWWAFPPANAECGDQYLEVGDPQGNGPDWFTFATVPVTLHGYTYHLQDLALLPWFTGETPSSAINGTYSFPDATQLTTPAAPCP